MPKGKKWRRQYTYDFVASEIKRRFGSVFRFCQQHQFCPVKVGDLLHGKSSPRDSQGGFKEVPLRIAQILGEPADLLFCPAPESLEVVEEGDLLLFDYFGL